MVRVDDDQTVRQESYIPQNHQASYNNALNPDSATCIMKVISPRSAIGSGWNLKSEKLDKSFFKGFKYMLEQTGK